MIKNFKIVPLNRQKSKMAQFPITAAIYFLLCGTSNSINNYNAFHCSCRDLLLIFLPSDTYINKQNKLWNVNLN